MTPNERFAKAAGICWFTASSVFFSNGISLCENCGKDHSNPDFTDAREVLKVMMEREDWRGFRIKINGSSYAASQTYADYIPTHLVTDRTGKLRDAAIEWMERRKG